MYRKQSFYIYMLMVLLAIVTSVNAQDRNSTVFGDVFLFNMHTTEKINRVRQPVYFSVSDTAIYTIFNRLDSNNKEGFVATRPASPVMLGVKLKANLTNFYAAIVPSITRDYYSFLINDSSDAVLVAMGINTTNYKDFRYRVVENDSVELVPWSPVKLGDGYGAHAPFGWIGTFNRPGKWIVVEVYNVKNYAVREGVVFDWRVNLRPQLEQVIVGVAGNYFNLASLPVNKGYATRFNRTTNVPEDMSFPADSIRYLTFQFRKEETRVYSVHLIRDVKGKKDTISQGMIDQHGYFSADPYTFNKPGKYEFVFQRQTRNPPWDEASLLRIHFEVTAPVAGNTLAQKILMVSGITICSLLLCFWLYRRSTKRMMQQMALQQETTQLKLKSIRSQLNPHFIFNALSSIQNLVNKQAVQEASHYLSRFAKLTRATLDSSNREMISLEEEWELTGHYLQMEQLRFGFTYTLTMDNTLQPVNIEVPPMLLQPLIENAVKHGVAGKSEGHIEVYTKQVDKNLVITVEDNGPGFETTNTTTGFGLKLNRERLELLNSIYPGQAFDMDIRSAESGTTISITFKNWLS